MEGMMSTFISSAYKKLWSGFKHKSVVINDLSVHPQRNNWSCGPLAMQYCMMRWGKDIDHRKLIKLAGSTRSAGTSESQLKRAAKLLHSNYTQYHLCSVRAAKNKIDDLLWRGLPLIVCIDKWEHWIAVLHHSHRGYLIFDSSRPGPVIQVRGWRWLEKHMRHHINGDTRPTYNVACVAKPVQRKK
jgi:ABC-type bacteriocin/lantibiotic exporter with double-glycine peptidase domain